MFSNGAKTVLVLVVIAIDCLVIGFEGVAAPMLQTDSKSAATSERAIFDWQRTDIFLPPNSERFFPDDRAAAQRLDQLWISPNRDRKSDEELLCAVKQGLRNTKKSSDIIRWVGGRYVWGRLPQNPAAIEILYHAIDLRGDLPEVNTSRDFAVYFGLSTVQPKTPAILRTLTELCLRTNDPNILSRIAWGVSAQRDDILPYLKPQLRSKDGIVRKKAADVVKILAGELNAFRWADQQRTTDPEKSGSAEIMADLASAPRTSYADTLKDLHEHLGRVYPSFSLKGIDWNSVGSEMIPFADRIHTERDFGLLVLELVAHLEDTHAVVLPGKARPPTPQLPQWDPGATCLTDDRGRAVVFAVWPSSPAARAGIKPGMAIISVNDTSAEEVLYGRMTRLRRYFGYSSERLLRYEATRVLLRQDEYGADVKLMLEEPDGRRLHAVVAADLGPRYLPRLPVPRTGISDSNDVSWVMLDDRIAYIYVRRIRGGLEMSLDEAIRSLGKATGLIVDLRGNSGGGFDPSTAFRNFDLSSSELADSTRPRFTGPIALLVDEGCVSAGEGWASWFVANHRARVFGVATAGASSRKDTYTLKNGLYSVVVPVKSYRGFLDRPIERRGIDPDTTLRCNARDLARGIDTVVEVARRWLLGRNR